MQHFDQLQSLENSQRCFHTIPQTTIVKLQGFSFQHELIQTIAPADKNANKNILINQTWMKTCVNTDTHARIHLAQVLPGKLGQIVDQKI